MKKTFLFEFALLLLLSAISLRSEGQPDIADAAFVKIDPKLGKVVYHRVIQHQTLYAIARGYGVDMEEIIKVNPTLKKDRSSLPPILVIPIDDELMYYRIPLLKNRQQFLPVYYQVQKKDNLFRVSRVYFDIPSGLLANRNNLKDDALKDGQTLHIGWLRKNFDPLSVHEGQLLADGDARLERPSVGLADKFSTDYADLHLQEKNEVAYWNKNETTKGLFVMHRSAAPQSIIEIKNPMFDRTVYAKVIGNIPAHLYPKEIHLVISADVADLLGAKDPKFFVRCRYKPDRASASR